MPADGTLYGNTRPAFEKIHIRGLLAASEGSINGPADGCFFETVTGKSPVQDLTATGAAQTLTLVQGNGAINGCPIGQKCYVTELQVFPTTSFSGGTAGTVSLTIQDFAGNVIATFTQAALSTVGSPVILPIGTLPSGVTAAQLQQLATNATASQGIQAVLSTNSTAGACRIRIAGFFAV